MLPWIVRGLYRHHVSQGEAEWRWVHRTVFVDCDFTGANLNRAHLEEADCRRAKFVGAKLRSAYCPRADFRGADFSGADLSHATLGGVRIDASTILEGAVLNGTGMEASFQQMAFQAGAIVDEANSMLDVACTLGRASARKLRLFAVACVRRYWDHITDPRSRHAVAVLERYADGLAGRDEYLAASGSAGQAVSDYLHRSGDGSPGTYDFCNYALMASLEDAKRAAQEIIRMGPLFRKTGPCSVSEEDILRDIFCMPSRTHSTLPAKRPDAVVKLAQAIYEEKAFDRMPILADVLEESGCRDEGILAHCRGQAKNQHVRGCWVVDRLLNRE